ncbi:MAG: helix-turn-helix domain-containing protein [Oscillospiraceae bacterium]|nr:helix-turn-helix domain-containing protein [Oscillospiraceae bacterium]
MNRIRELRKQVNMTQKELAKQLQIADSTLSYWEMGKYEPDTNALMKLSRFFNVPIDYILSGDFTSWNVSEKYVPYQGVDATETTTAPNATDIRRDIRAAFNRAEFDGLTQSEMELLAEYAEFIKSRRKSGLV